MRAHTLTLMGGSTFYSWGVSLGVCVCVLNCLHEFRHHLAQTSGFSVSKLSQISTHRFESL